MFILPSFLRKPCNFQLTLNLEKKLEMFDPGREERKRGREREILPCLVAQRSDENNDKRKKKKGKKSIDTHRVGLI